MERRLILLLVVFALVVVGLLPLAAMLGKSIFVDGRLTLATYEKLFADPWQQWLPMEHSLTLATLTAGCVTCIASNLTKLLRGVPEYNAEPSPCCCSRRSRLPCVAEP